MGRMGGMGEMGEIGKIGEMFVVTTSVVAKSVMADAMTLSMSGLSAGLETGCLASNGA
jgi:hypothetical protein